MNSIDKNIFNNYETVETVLLNELATEVKTKGKKARTLKGEGYYVKYDGVQYDITPEQCRIYKLIRNNYNMFVEQLNSAKSDVLGFWKIGFGDRLPAIIADLEKGLEICQKYFDAFKSYITEVEDEEEVASEETVEENGETENVVEAETSVCDLHSQGQDRDADEYVAETCTLIEPTSPTAPHGGSSCTTKNGSQKPQISRLNGSFTAYLLCNT